METAHIAIFECSLPDDAVEEAGVVTRPNGSVLGEVIAAELREREWSISVVQQRGDTGWSFWGKIHGTTFWCLLGFVDPWVMIVVDRRFFLKRWVGGVGPFLQVLEEVNRTLRGIAEISELAWITESEYEAARVGS